jgi:hypothetical protein
MALLEWRKKGIYLNDGRSYPAAVGQDESEEEVRVDLVPQAPHLSGNFLKV